MVIIALDFSVFIFFGDYITMSDKSCVINPATGRAIIVGSALYKRLDKKGAFKKDSVERSAGKIREKKKAKAKEAKKVKEETPEEKVKKINVKIKELEKKLGGIDDELTSGAKAKKIADEKKMLRRQWLEARREVAKKKKAMKK